MKKILLVDDNEADRVLYERYLKRQESYERLEFVAAATGEEALLAFRTHHPDCVLLDYNLPDMTGLEVLQALQQFRPVGALCVVMITGGGSERLAVAALNNGALDYLVKGSFDPELLGKTVRHAIEKNEWRQYQSRYHNELQNVNQQLRESLMSLNQAREELKRKNQELITAHELERQHNEELDLINRRLTRTNADLDNFVYAASHDLRQPVHNLRGLFDELRRTATFHDPEEAQVLRLVDESLGALSTTINDLAYVVQVEQLPGEHPPETVLFEELLAEVLNTLRPQILEANATIEADFSALPALEYVPGNLRTILLNLISNAIKYRHPKRNPEILVRTLLCQSQAVLEVQDNGLGINLERYGNELFQLFRRFHPAAGEGTGVGLFLVNRLVQSAGGSIEVSSHVDQGTTFRVILQR